MINIFNSRCATTDWVYFVSAFTSVVWDVTTEVVRTGYAVLILSSRSRDVVYFSLHRNLQHSPPHSRSPILLKVLLYKIRHLTPMDFPSNAKMSYWRSVDLFICLMESSSSRKEDTPDSQGQMMIRNVRVWLKKILSRHVIHHVTSMAQSPRNV